jgi:hypothetical protein
MAPISERHFMVKDIAGLWNRNLSPVAVRCLFMNEPGVLVIGRRAASRRKRVYRTLRIPESVVSRVMDRLSNHLLAFFQSLTKRGFMLSPQERLE